MRDLFPDERLFAVEDVMPACKPEPAAFAAVLERVGATAEEAEAGSQGGRLQSVMGDVRQSPSAAATFRIGRVARRSQGDA